jgi:hypothetical protein
MVIVFVMHFQQLQIDMIEGARTAPTDPGKQPQSLCPVTLLPYFSATSCLKDQTIKTFIGFCHRQPLPFS